MALSTIVKKLCPECGKVAIEASRFAIGTTTMVTLKCGHIVFQSKAEEADDYDITSYTRGHKLKPFQIEGVKFGEASNFRCLIGDDTGLGKMVQAMAMLRLHPELLPALVVTKATLKHQWFHELREWCGKESDYLTQLLASGKEKALPGFQVYIATYDYIKNEDAFDMLEGHIKTIIIDECQAVKNHLSGRGKAIQKVSKGCDNVIALSATPIKNNAGEYFTILNILQPMLFPTYDGFIRNYCDSYETMYGWKIGGLSNPEFFREQTKDFIIRRTREEVAPELPKVFRQFHHVELDRRLNKAYAAALQELEDLMYSDDENAMAAKIVIMTKMRRITGLSKAAVEAKDYACRFLEDTDRKLVIFVHHRSVSRMLNMKINEWVDIENGKKENIEKAVHYEHTLDFNASLSADARDELVTKFRDTDHRILIASTLAAGEGLNLQFCSDAVMLERQWNPANEEQAEGRFSRFGTIANQINIVYMLASETIDEYFTELVERKRAIVSSTLDNKEVAWDSNSLMNDLAAILIAKGKSKFRI